MTAAGVATGADAGGVAGGVAAGCAITASEEIPAATKPNRFKVRLIDRWGVKNRMARGAAAPHPEPDKDYRD